MRQKVLLQFLFACMLMIASAPIYSLKAQTDTIPVNTVHDTICNNQLPTYTFLGESFLQGGTFDIPVMAQDSTDSVIMRLELWVWDNHTDTVILADCSSEFPIQYAGQVTFRGETETTLSFSADTNGCPIYTYFHVTAYPTYNDTLPVHICKSELPYIFGEDTLTGPGLYTHSSSTEFGCDSILTIDLMIHSVYDVADTLTDTICSFYLPYTYGDSLFYKTGVYDFNLHSAYGCDSAHIHLDLTVLKTITDTLEYTICQNNFPFELDSVHYYNEAGTYYIEHDDTRQCHDITVLILHSLPFHDDTVTVNLCDVELPYAFADSLFMETTVYTHFDTTLLGCDSNTTLVLNVHKTYTEVDTVDILTCRADLPTQFKDTLLTEEGIYTFHAESEFGCDSITDIIRFTILEHPADTLELILCSNQFPYEYKDTLIDSAGTYLLRIPTDSLGCDTFRLLTLREVPIYHDTLIAVTCANEPYVIGDSVFTVPGTYDVPMFSEYGCDSLITVILDHNPIYHSETYEVAICVTDLPYVYGDSSFYTEGYHEIPYQTIHGCDSIIAINLTINPILYNSDTLYHEICRNELPFTAFGRTLTAEGTYTYVTSSQVTGCDSVFYYHLTVHDNPVVAIEGDSHLCEGSTTMLTVQPAMSAYQWNNGFTSQLMEIHQPGSYSVTVTDEHGCQSSADKVVANAQLPNIHISGNQAICYGDSAVLTVSGGSSYRWESGSTDTRIVVYPTATTTYRVTGTDATPCSNESQFTVTVRALPVPSISGNNVICQGESTVFTASNNHAYRWSTGATANHITVQQAGVYAVTVTDAHGCQGSTQRELTVNAKPEARISGANHFCSGESSILKAEPTAAAYLWSYNDLSDQSITITEGGVYSVTVTNVHGCSNVATKTITIDTLPRIIITGSQIICQGESAVLTVSGADSYVWDNGSSDNQITVYPTENTTYRVTGTNSTSCTNKNSFSISVKSLPVPTITSNKTAICRGDSAVLTASVGSLSAGSSYHWSNEKTTNKITIYDASTYTVTVTDPYGCQGTAFYNLTVNENPNAVVSGISHFCEGGQTTLKAMPDGCSYIWSHNGMSDQTITITSSGSYVVTVTNAAGCKSVASKDVTTDPLPNIHITGTSAICMGDSAVLTVSGANTYRWDNGSTASRIVVHPTAQTTYRVTGTSLTPCSNESAFTVSVRSLPTPTISGNNTICQGDNATFIANGGQHYQWSTGVQGDRITVSEANTYRVTATDQYGCKGTATRDLTVNERPNVLISGNSHFCAGQSSTLKAMPNNCTYHWNHNELTQQEITITSGGTYIVTVTNSHGCSNTMTKEVVLDTVPVLNITGNAAVCLGDSAVLTVTGANTYRWDNGSTGARIIVVPTAQTTYRVTGTNNTPCSSDNSFTVSIRQLPTPTISGNNSICQGESSQFVATGGQQYRWSTGVQGDRITVSEANTYSVTATDQYGCKGTTTRDLTVHERPDALISGNSHFCAGQTGTLRAMPNNCTYRWSHDEQTQQNVTISSGGTYMVTVTNTYGCSNTASKEVVLDTIPILNITGTSAICIGDSAVLTVSGANTYRWDNGSTDARIVVFPTTQTTYRVTGTNNTPCSNDNSFTIAVRDLPVPSITGNNTICQGENVVFVANGGQQYRWSTGVQGDRITVSEANTYSVTATDQYGCMGSATRDLTVNERPNAVISGNTHFCAGQSSALTAMPNNCSYRWSHNDQTQQTATVTAGGHYTVTVTNSYGCSNTATKDVIMDTLPILNITGTSAICLGDTAVLMVSGANSYHWDNGSTDARIIVFPTTQTTYRVTGTNNTPCSNESAFTVSVRSLPTPTISGGNDICQGDSSLFIALGGSTYQWSTGTTGDRITVRNADTYTVTATDQYGCKGTANRSLTVNRTPDVRINGSSLFCQGRSTTLTAVGASTYEWQETGDITQSITVSQPGTYTVIGTSDKGCRATASKSISTTQVSNVSFSGSTSFCHGQSTTLTVIGDNQYTYDWNNGLSTSSISITTPGIYSVTITDAHNCQKILTTTIIENQLPTPVISGNLEICEGNTTKLTASGGQTYLWDGYFTTPSITVSNSGTYNVTVTNINGCSASTSVDVTVHPKPTIQIMSSRDHVCSSSESITLRAIVPNGVSYFWNTGQETQSITVTPGTTNTYNVYVFDSHGCSNTSTITIQVSPEITPFITGNTSICQGNSTTLIASSNAITPEYQWSTHQASNSITVNTPGTYTVTVTDNSGCTGTASVAVNVNDLPNAIISNRTTICQGDTATLTVQTDPNCAVVWRTETSATDLSNQNTLRVTEPGIYMAVITNSNGCSVVRSTEVVRNPKPQVSISGNTLICQGNSTTLFAEGDSTNDYQWAAAHNRVLEVSTPGTYTVTATNTYNCSSTASVQVTVRELPTPSISGISTICPNGSTTLTATPAVTYLWSTGDTLGSITVYPTADTVYSVSVTDEYGCSGSTSYPVHISPLPVVAISGQLEFCSGNSTTLTVTPGYTYLWSTQATANSITVSDANTYTVTAYNEIGCQSTASATTTVHALPELNFGMQHDICNGESYTYVLPADSNLSYRWSNNATGNTLTVQTAGTYSVTVTNQYGCSRSASDQLIVHNLPTPTITGETSVCRGTTTTLSVSGGTRYHWSTNAYTNFIQVTPNNNTTYSVTAYNEYNCSATAYHSITVKVLPSIYFSGETTFCEGSSTDITASGGSNCTWSTGSNNNTITVSTPGTYSVTVTNLQGCQSSDTISVRTRPNPIVQISGSSMICAGGSVTLNATGGSTYEWSTGSTNNSTTVMPSVTTDYSVTGYDQYGCFSTAHKTVNVEALPDIHISGVNAICYGDSTTFTVTGGNQYHWSTGAQGNHIRVANAGSYTVTATSTNGCSSSESITLTLYPTPVASITGATSICENTSATLVAQGGDFYHWNTGSTSSTLPITSGGTYTVEVSNGYDCSSTASITVADLSAPTLYLSGAGSICEGSGTHLVAYGNAAQYQWSTGETGQDITVTPTTSTLYHVTATGANGCLKTDSLYLTVNPTYHVDILGSICEGATYTQNGFDIPAQTEPGVFTFDRNLSSIHGCDSIITLTLTVKPLPVLPDSITGNPRITHHGSYSFSVAGTQYANTFEWRVSNLNWTFNTNTNLNTITLNVEQNGSGILTAKAINECGFREVSLEIYCNVSVDEYTNESNILVYPVPTYDQLSINLEQAADNVDKILIYDLSGRLVQSVPVTESLVRISCGQFAAGQYLIRFLNADGKTVDTRKIIIRK